MTDASADLRQVDSVRAYLRQMYPKFKADVEHGSLMPMNFVVVTRSPQTGEELAEPGIMIVGTPNLPDNNAKDALSYALRSLIDKTKAIAIASIAESWMILNDNATPEEYEETKKYIDKHKSIQGHPDTKEVIMITLEHYRLEGTEMIYAVIERDADNKPIVGEFVVQPPMPLKGRFAGYLHKLN